MIPKVKSIYINYEKSRCNNYRFDIYYNLLKQFSVEDVLDNMELLCGLVSHDSIIYFDFLYKKYKTMQVSYQNIKRSFLYNNIFFLNLKYLSKIKFFCYSCYLHKLSSLKFITGSVSLTVLLNLQNVSELYILKIFSDVYCFTIKKFEFIKLQKHICGSLAHIKLKQQAVSIDCVYTDAAYLSILFFFKKNLSFYNINKLFSKLKKKQLYDYIGFFYKSIIKFNNFSTEQVFSIYIAESKKKQEYVSNFSGWRYKFFLKKKTLAVRRKDFELFDDCYILYNKLSANCTNSKELLDFFFNTVDVFDNKSAEGLNFSNTSQELLDNSSISESLAQTNKLDINYLNISYGAPLLRFFMFKIKYNIFISFKKVCNNVKNYNIYNINNIFIKNKLSFFFKKTKFNLFNKFTQVYLNTMYLNKKYIYCSTLSAFFINNTYYNIIQDWSFGAHDVFLESLFVTTTEAFKSSIYISLFTSFSCITTKIDNFSRTVDAGDPCLDDYTIINLYKNFGKNVNKLFIQFFKRIQFKPGYPRFFRGLRQHYQEVYNLKFLYQKHLTKYLCRFKKLFGCILLQFHELSIQAVLKRARFFLINSSISLIFSYKLVYLNGFICINKFTQLQFEDFIQIKLYYSLYLYISRFNTFLFKKVYDLFFKNLINKVDILRDSAPHMLEELGELFRPATGLTHKNFILIYSIITDIPQYIEVDFLTLSIMLVYMPKSLNDFNLLNVYSSFFGSFRMLNWKYLT